MEWIFCLASRVKQSKRKVQFQKGDLENTMKDQKILFHYFLKKIIPSTERAERKLHPCGNPFCA